jgi:glycosyltransferase involved in cell wall biosynthesis
MLALNVTRTAWSRLYLWKQQGNRLDASAVRLRDRNDAKQIVGNSPVNAEINKALCFTLWFRTHNNLRYAVLFPELVPVVEFCKVTLSDRRLVKALQFRLWIGLNRRVIYPAVARHFARRYPTVFTVDTYQIPAWPETQRVIVDMDDPVFSPREFEILKLPQVKVIVVTTEKAKAIYQRHGITCAIHVIPQGIPVDQINGSKVQEICAQFKGDRDVVIGYHAPTLTLLFDGPHRVRGGQDDLDFLFTALGTARKVEPRLKLWLFGKPSASVKKYAAVAGADWIRLFGYVPFSDILNYVSSLDIGVYPRTWVQPPARFNVKLAQFLACGVPVVSTDLDESFIVRETGCGIVCKSQEDFAEALVALAQSAEKRAELGNAGRTYAKRNLDLPTLASIYRDILNGVRHGS